MQKDKSTLYLWGTWYARGSLEWSRPGWEGRDVNEVPFPSSLSQTAGERSGRAFKVDAFPGQEMWTVQKGHYWDPSIHFPQNLAFLTTVRLGWICLRLTPLKILSFSVEHSTLSEIPVQVTIHLLHLCVMWGQELCLDIWGPLVSDTVPDIYVNI